MKKIIILALLFVGCAADYRGQVHSIVVGSNHFYITSIERDPTYNHIFYISANADTRFIANHIKVRMKQKKVFNDIMIEHGYRAYRIEGHWESLSLAFRIQNFEVHFFKTKEEMLRWK